MQLCNALDNLAVHTVLSHVYSTDLDAAVHLLLVLLHWLHQAKEIAADPCMTDAAGTLTAAGVPPPADVGYPYLGAHQRTESVHQCVTLPQTCYAA